jgi:hypothetical protein
MKVCNATCLLIRIGECSVSEQLRTVVHPQIPAMLERMAIRLRNQHARIRCANVREEQRAPNLHGKALEIQIVPGSK